jgi:DNA-binding transcriptional LysR family regulator
VSVQLSQLEREAGVALLHKAGRNVELTEAGHRLAEHAAQALAADEAVRAELATLESEVRGNLRMAFVQTPALALLPGVLDHLSRSAPKLEVEVVHRETVPALNELRSGPWISSSVSSTARYRWRTQDVHRQDLLHETCCCPADATRSQRRTPGR